MTQTIKVFGHKSPDTDSVCSAIIWAWYLTHIKKTPAIPYVLGTPNTEALFVAEKWGFEIPELLADLSAGDEVAIVDTNNPKELPDNINEARVLHLIDHHKLVGGLETLHPLDMTIRTLACTTTVIYELFRESEKEQLPENIKGLILSAIISDTLDFRSPTTTDIDKAVVAQLASELKIDVKAYATEMFAAKSDVSHLSNADILRLDSKLYEVGGKNFRISVLETTLPSIALERKDSLKASMKIVASEDNVDEVLFFLIDILNEEAIVMIPNETVRGIIEKSFADIENREEDLITLPGVMSRKKQIIPGLKV